MCVIQRTFSVGSPETLRPCDCNNLLNSISQAIKTGTSIHYGGIPNVFIAW